MAFYTGSGPEVNKAASSTRFFKFYLTTKLEATTRTTSADPVPGTPRLLDKSPRHP